MPRDLTGRVIIITGASSGIGAATAIECAKAGMDVLITARRADRLEVVAEEVRALGRRAVVVAGNVTDEAMSQRLLDAAERELGGFYAVFANAGYGCEKSMVDLSMDELREMFEVNFFSAFDLVQKAAQRLLAANKPGHLLMCASCLSKFTLPLHGHYSATKASQTHVCWAMHAELARHHIEVSSVLPITTATEFFQSSAVRSGREGIVGMTPDHAPRLFTQTPERVAKAIVKCLRRPKPEVWTSHIVRLVAGAMTMFPWTAEAMMRSQMKSERKRSMTERPDRGGTPRSATESHGGG